MTLTTVKGTDQQFAQQIKFKSCFNYWWTIFIVFVPGEISQQQQPEPLLSTFKRNTFVTKLNLLSNLKKSLLCIVVLCTNPPPPPPSPAATLGEDADQGRCSIAFDICMLYSVHPLHRIIESVCCPPFSVSLISYIWNYSKVLFSFQSTVLFFEVFFPFYRSQGAGPSSSPSPAPPSPSSGPPPSSAPRSPFSSYTCQTFRCLQIRIRIRIQES